MDLNIKTMLLFIYYMEKVEGEDGRHVLRTHVFRALVDQGGPGGLGPLDPRF